jgi:hypothetical protein
MPTASRVGDAQIGLGFSLGSPGYPPQTKFQGLSAYADFDFRPHLGIEAEFRQIDHSGGYSSFQRTIAIGGRYLRTYGALAPYVKLLAGRGTFEYPYAETELGYPMLAAGAGADFAVGQSLRLRGEYEFQRWSSFPNGGLTPQIFTVGVAYHPRGRGARRQ